MGKRASPCVLEPSGSGVLNVLVWEGMHGNKWQRGETNGFMFGKHRSLAKSHHPCWT